MNQPWVYLYSPSGTPLPPPSPSHPSGSSQCTSPEHPVSYIEPGLAICFTYDNIHVSMLFSQIIPHSHLLPESKRLFYTSVSLLLSLIWVIVTIYYFAESFFSQWELDSISSRFDFLFTYIPLSFTANLQASNLHKSVSCSVFEIPCTTDC